MLIQAGTHHVDATRRRKLHAGRIVEIAVGRVGFVRLQDQRQRFEPVETIAGRSPDGPPASPDSPVNNVLTEPFVPKSGILAVGEQGADWFWIARPDEAIRRGHARDPVRLAADVAEAPLRDCLEPLLGGGVGIDKNARTMHA